MQQKKYLNCTYPFERVSSQKNWWSLSNKMPLTIQHSKKVVANLSALDRSSNFQPLMPANWHGSTNLDLLKFIWSKFKLFDQSF